MKQLIAIGLLLLIPSTFAFATITKYVDEDGVLRIESIEGGKPSRTLFEFTGVVLEIINIKKGEIQGDKVQLLIDIAVENYTGKALQLNEPWKSFTVRNGDQSFQVVSPGSGKTIQVNSSTVDTLTFEIPDNEYYGNRFEVVGKPAFLPNEEIRFSFIWGCWLKPQAMSTAQRSSLHRGRSSGSVGKQTQTRQKSHYIGNTNTKKYHTPGCHHLNKMNREHRVTFKSAQEAKNKGYSQCRDCM